MAPGERKIWKKTAFRCVEALRNVVAAAMTLLMAVVILSAVKVVHRPHDLTLWIVGGSVPVHRSGNLSGPFNPSVGADNLTFSLTIRAVNPSSSVRIYYTNLIVILRGRNSSSAMNGFLALRLPDMDVEQQSVWEIEVWKTTHMKLPSLQQFYFESLDNGTSFTGASLKLNGTRIVQSIYTGHNISHDQAVYYCSPVTFGASPTRAAVDTACTQDAPSFILDYPSIS